MHTKFNLNYQMLINNEERGILVHSRNPVIDCNMRIRFTGVSMQSGLIESKAMRQNLDTKSMK